MAISEQNPFYENPSITAQFELGLQLAKAEPVAVPNTIFAGGLRALGTPEAYISGDGDPQRITACGLPLQASRGLRDWGVAHVRQGLAKGSESQVLSSFGRAAQLLKCADYVVRGVDARTESGELESNEHRLAALAAFGGVVHALELRAASAEKAKLGGWCVFWKGGSGRVFDWMMDTLDAGFWQVCEELGRGNNGYFRVSHAGAALRNRLVCGEHWWSAQASRWRSQIDKELEWTRVNDPAQYAQSYRTAMRHRMSSLSIRMASRAAASPKRF